MIQYNGPVGDLAIEKTDDGELVIGSHGQQDVFGHDIRYCVTMIKDAAGAWVIDARNTNFGNTTAAHLIAYCQSALVAYVNAWVKEVSEEKSI